MRRKRVEETSDILSSIVEEKIETNEEIAAAMERYQTFARSLFGENHEPGTVKIRKGESDPLKITMLKVEREFMLAQKGRNNTPQTISTYGVHFNRIFDFLGFEYLMQSKDIAEDAINNPEKYGKSARQIGASMPVKVLELENITAFYRDYLLNRGLSEQTVISSLRNLRAIIYFAQEEKWIKKFSIKIRDSKPPLKPLFTDAEIQRLKKKPKITKDTFVEYRSWVMIQYLSATGNRISSVLALNVGDIDFENNIIMVNVQKNREPKPMPLIYDIRKILKEYIYRTRTDVTTGIPCYREPLFCNQDGNRLSYTGARDAMQDYFKERGVVWTGFHKFRHSYAANWIMDGGNPFLLKEQLGHSSLAMTNRYANIYGMATKDEAEKHSLSSKFRDNRRGNRIKVR